MSSAVLASRRPGPLAWVRRIGFTLLGIVAVLALAAWLATILLRPHPPSPASITRAMRAQAALTGGAKVYVTYCAGCHNTGFGPALAGLDLPYEAVQSFVRLGPGMMQAFTPSEVSDADTQALTIYINELKPHDKASE